MINNFIKIDEIDKQQDAAEWIKPYEMLKEITEEKDFLSYNKKNYKKEDLNGILSFLTKNFINTKDNQIYLANKLMAQEAANIEVEFI